MTFEDAIPALFEAVSRFGARPDIPIEAEKYFTDLVATYDDEESLRSFLPIHARELFKCLDYLPEWIQEPDWPWEEGKPMLFVGSIDIAKGLLHDDARLFVFWAPSVGTTKCVIQVS